jgi:hypothetical protein
MDLPCVHAVWNHWRAAFAATFSMPELQVRVVFVTHWNASDTVREFVMK